MRVFIDFPRRLPVARLNEATTKPPVIHHATLSRTLVTLGCFKCAAARWTNHIADLDAPTIDGELPRFNRVVRKIVIAHVDGGRGRSGTPLGLPYFICGKLHRPTVLGLLGLVRR